MVLEVERLSFQESSMGMGIFLESNFAAEVLTYIFLVIGVLARIFLIAGVFVGVFILAGIMGSVLLRVACYF